MSRRDLGPIWITKILGDIIQFSSLDFQNAWVPQKNFVFGLVFNICFHHSKLKKLSLSDEN